MGKLSFGLFEGVGPGFGLQRKQMAMPCVYEMPISQRDELLDDSPVMLERHDGSLFS